jgi:hypothetical protein
MRMLALALPSLLALAPSISPSVRAQQPPQVVELSPARFSAEVDATKTTTLTIKFDRSMSTTGFSFCGGGPAFPKFKGRPVWKDDRTITVEVELEPDHDYHLGLNAPAAQNFRSAAGTPLVPVQWLFSTLPKELPDQGSQAMRNKKALDLLVDAIDAHYSHRDLRVHDWKKRYADSKAALLGARTDKGFAAAAAALLQPTEDIHLYVRCGDSTFPTGTRAVDPLFRLELLDKYVEKQQVGPNALVGRSGDGIGYLMVGEWTDRIDVTAIAKALAGMRDCKAFVVDARPNSGGDESLAQRIAAWFVEGTKVYAKNRYRTKPGKDGFGPVLDRTITGNDAERRVDVPIAVLTSRYVMSSNESFVLMLQQARDCTTIGQPTFGSSGNPKPFDLRNGVTVVIPSWQDLRLDGTCFEGEGLKPDVAVECTAEQLEQKDPILEKALELLRGKVAKAKGR